MSKTRIAVIEFHVDLEEDTVTTKIQGKSGVKVATIAENLMGLLEGMAGVLEKNPEALMGGFEKDYQEEVDNG
jgi:hypothetical protein